MTYTTKHSITIAFDTANLQGYSDEFLAQLWHVAQANPAPITDRDAGEIAENIGREIISRWLKRQPAALWNHQGRHYSGSILSDHGHWPGPTHDRWVYGKSEETARDVGARAARQFEAATTPATIPTEAPSVASLEEL
jgi:hypothetical protein